MSLSLSLTSLSFSPAAMPAVQVMRSSGVNMAIAKPSKAVPFLEAPPCQSSKLAGAETGFDPLYLSEYIDIKWAREAELKHGRICMLAAAGYFFQEFLAIPGYPGYTPNGIDAATAVPPEAMLQILLFTSVIEYNSNLNKWTQDTMFTDPKREPGNLGFDPLRFGDKKASRARLEMAELKNGRLAMLAFSGMIHQTFVTGKPVFASLQDIFA